MVSTFADMPAGIAVEIIAAVSGSLVMAGRVVSRQVKKKTKKHDYMRKLVETVLRNISQITSRALNDGIMSDSEYQLVLDEVERFAD